MTPGRQRRSFGGRGLPVKDQSLSSAGSCELGNGLRHGQETRRLHQSVPVSSLDIYSHEGERLPLSHVLIFLKSRKDPGVTDVFLFFSVANRTITAHQGFTNWPGHEIRHEHLSRPCRGQRDFLMRMKIVRTTPVTGHFSN